MKFKLTLKELMALSDWARSNFRELVAYNNLDYNGVEENVEISIGEDIVMEDTSKNGLGVITRITRKYFK